MKRQFCERAYFRACSLAASGFLSSALASRTMSGKPLVSSRRKSTKPLLAFSKLSPSASRSTDLIVTLGSRRMFAGFSPMGKKRQLAASRSLLILIRAVASFSDTQVPRSATMVVKRHSAGFCGGRSNKTRAQRVLHRQKTASTSSGRTLGAARDAPRADHYHGRRARQRRGASGAYSCDLVPSQTHFHGIRRIQLHDRADVASTEADVGQIMRQHDGIELSKGCHRRFPGCAVINRGSVSPFRTIQTGTKTTVSPNGLLIIPRTAYFCPNTKAVASSGVAVTTQPSREHSPS